MEIGKNADKQDEVKHVRRYGNLSNLWVSSISLLARSGCFHSQYCYVLNKTRHSNIHIQDLTNWSRQKRRGNQSTHSTCS